MKNMIKFIVIAAAVAGSASNALAEETYHRHAHRSMIERYGDPELSEGRNSSRWWGYSNTSTDRESVVEAPGN